MANDNNVDVRVGVTGARTVERELKRTGEATRRTVGDMAREQTRMGRATETSERALGRQSRKLRDKTAAATRYAKSVGQAVQQNQKLQKVLHATGKGLDAIDNKWTAIGGTIGGAATARGVVDLSARYTRLGIQADLSAEQVDRLKEEVFALSQASDIRVDDVEVLSAIEQIVEKTGDLQLARNNIRNIAMTLSATGAVGADVGAMMADISEKFNIRNASEMLRQLDTLVVQGKEGAFTLQALASKGSATSAAYAAMGRTGAQAVREMGALLQVGMMGTGNADTAATAFEATLRDLVSNRDKLEDLGVDLFDPEKLAQGIEEARAIPDVLKEIVQATGGNVSQFSDVFGDESRRLVNVLASEFKRTGGFGSLDKFMAISGDGSVIMQDSARAATTAAAAMNNFYNAWRRMADSSLAEPIQSLADALNSLDPDTVQTILKGIAGGALALGGLAIGRRVVGGVSGAIGFFRGGRGKGGGGKAAAAGGLGAVAGVTPVFVTNMPVGGLGGALPGGSRRAGGRVGRLGRMGGGLKLLGRAAAPLALVGGALSIGSTLADSSLTGQEKATGIGGDLGGIGGALGGAAAGAAIGSVVPVIGTAVGGIVGSIIGGMGGSWLGGKAGSALAGGNSSDAMNSAIKSATAKSSPPTTATQQPPVAVRFEQTFVQQPGQSATELATNVRAAVRDEMDRIMAQWQQRNTRLLTDNA